MRGDPLPRFYDVRRVPVRYHQILELAVIKRHQCVVLGASRNILTVGITRCDNNTLLDFLQILTGAAIFPVLIDPKRMGLLIARLERYRRLSQRSSRIDCALQLPAQVRLILRFKERVAR